MYFKELFNRMDKQDVKLQSIEEQTIKTNGRVNLLEREEMLRKEREALAEKAKDRWLKIGMWIGIPLITAGIWFARQQSTLIAEKAAKSVIDQLTANPTVTTTEEK